MVKNGQWVVKNSQIRSTMGRKPIIVNMANVVNPFNKIFIYLLLLLLSLLLLLLLSLLQSHFTRDCHTIFFV